MASVAPTPSPSSLSDDELEEFQLFLDRLAPSVRDGMLEQLGAKEGPARSNVEAAQREVQAAQAALEQARAAERTSQPLLIAD